MTKCLALAVVLAALLGGCGGALEPYETEGGEPTRLDGTKATGEWLTVAEAIERRPVRPAYVEGYVLAPYDDVARLCSDLSEDVCRGPWIVLDMSRVEATGRLDALEWGCCSLGGWSPRPVVVRLRLENPRRGEVLG